jgi:hypothetical protein
MGCPGCQPLAHSSSPRKWQSPCDTPCECSQANPSTADPAPSSSRLSTMSLPRRRTQGLGGRCTPRDCRAGPRRQTRAGSHDAAVGRACPLVSKVNKHPRIRNPASEPAGLITAPTPWSDFGRKRTICMPPPGRAGWVSYYDRDSLQVDFFLRQMHSDLPARRR